MSDMPDFEIVNDVDVDLIDEKEEGDQPSVAPAKGLTPEEVAEIAASLKRVDLSPCTHFLSTGCTLLDLGIADRLPGGFGGGRISHLYGKESTSKTVLMTEVLGSAQRQGGKAYCEDAELTFDFPRAKIFGVDVSDDSKWGYACPTSLEDLWDNHVAKIVAGRSRKSPHGIVGVDSLSALPSIKELDGTLGEKSYGMSRAKIQSEAFRKYLHTVNDVNLAMLFIDQTRTNVNVTYGDKSTFSGGDALRFYASTRVKLTYTGKILNSYKVPVGVEIEFNVVKNKIAPPFRKGKFRLLFEFGICDVSSNLVWLKEWDKEEYSNAEVEEVVENGKKKKRKEAAYIFGGEKKKSLATMVQFIEESSLEDVLRSRVEVVWHEVHSTRERKAKKRWN